MRLIDENTANDLLAKVESIECKLTFVKEGGALEIPMTEEEAIRAFGFKERTFKQWRRQGAFPSYKIGKSHIFVFVSEINEWIRRHKI